MVSNTGFLFLRFQSLCDVKPVVRAQVEYKDMVLRIDTLGLDLAEYAVLAAPNALVLVVHDGSSTYGSILAQVACKAGDCWDDDNDPEFAAFSSSVHTSIYDCAANLIVDWALLLSSCSDCLFLAFNHHIDSRTPTEELVFNVHIVLGIADDVAISCLNTVLWGIKTTAPIRTTSHKLCMHCSPILEAFGAQRGQRMMNVVSNGKFGSLNTHKILIGPLSVLQCQPVIPFVTLVLVTLAEIPAKDKVLCDVIYARPNYAHSDVMPRHAAILCLAELVRFPVVNTLEVHDTVVVEVLAGEDLVLHSGRMHIGQWVLLFIPSPIAKI